MPTIRGRDAFLNITRNLTLFRAQDAQMTSRIDSSSVVVDLFQKKRHTSYRNINFMNFGAKFQFYRAAQPFSAFILFRLLLL